MKMCFWLQCYIFCCTVVTDFPARFTVFVNDDTDSWFILDLIIPSVWVPEILCIIHEIFLEGIMDVATSEL
jgi:hypothetical protein